MKNMYRATRPAWATLDKTEFGFILGASIVLGLYGGWGESIATRLLAYLSLDDLAHRFWPIVDVVVVSFGCISLIAFYKHRSIGCYPSTFLYCFCVPEKSNPSGKSVVVGFCHIKPDFQAGEIIVEGASFFWENGALNPDGTGFRSTQVRGECRNGEVICQIRFDINADDQPKRTYRHGLLQFQSIPPSEGRGSKDRYAGSLRSYRMDLELGGVEVKAKGYAEKYAEGCAPEDEIRLALQRKGDVLHGELNAMLHTYTNQPSLWKAEKLQTKLNYWDIEIPSPQSVVLNLNLSPYIVSYLTTVLGRFGMTEADIKQFIVRATQAAKQENDDTVAFEKILKQHLAGTGARRKEDAALAHRARIIYDEIKAHFVGQSLLDVGCGNGLISSLAKSQFKKIQLLDVVGYPKVFDLPFLLYSEGYPFPTTEKFDTVLVLTVLHHSPRPVDLLKLAYAAADKRLIIIESVVGVKEAHPPAKYSLVEETPENQVAFAAFVDWFYNRVLHDDIPVPYNFTTVDQWLLTFQQQNMSVSRIEYFGQDIEIGPEYHVMFVIDKQGTTKSDANDS